MSRGRWAFSIIQIEQMFKTVLITAVSAADDLRTAKVLPHQTQSDAWPRLFALFKWTDLGIYAPVL